MNGPQAIIRDERAGDEAAIREVLTAAFPSEQVARLVDDLRRGGRLALSLVAAVEERIVGHVGFSPVTIEGAPGGLGLAPVAVAPDFQGRGTGAALIRAGLAACGQRGAGFVVVLGEPAFYRRFGFKPAGRWKLTDAYGGGEAFQAIELRPGAIPTREALVRYAPEFSLFASEETS